jgi:AraC family L-rhamnose operon regulatory protein RhaS
MINNSNLAVKITDSENERKDFPDTFWEIVLFIDGVTDVRIGSQNFSIKAPVCYCLNRKESFNVLNRSRFLALGFDPRMVNSTFNPEQISRSRPMPEDYAGRLDLFWADCFIRDSGELLKPVILYPQSVRFLEENFIKIGDELTNKPDSYWPCRVRSFLIESLLHIGRIFHQPGRIPDKTPGIPDHPSEKVRLYLQTHYSEKISLNGLANMFCTNKTSLEENFAELTGKTVFAYLRDLRISLARNLLQETTLTVAEVALMAGYADPTHFGRIFKKYLKELPVRYRKRFGGK